MYFTKARRRYKMTALIFAGDKGEKFQYNSVLEKEVVLQVLKLM